MEVIPQVHQVRTHGSNIIVIAGEQLTLIDAGPVGSAGTLLQYLSRLGRSPQDIALIVLTHYHLDHSGGLAALRRLSGARVAVHEADAPYVRSGIIDPRLRLPFLSRIQPAVPVDIELKGGQRLEPLGGLEVIHTPGHTPGSISLYSPSRGLLIVGDALIHHRHRLTTPLWIINRDTAEARRSASKLSGFDCRAICFGHGKPVTEDAQARLAHSCTD